MKFYIADAFTEELFGGNPAGVVILDDATDFPDDELMRKTAAELRYSETAFIKKLNEKDFQVRYFTPASEVDLCGHATIASFGCLREAGIISPGSKYTCRTLAGDLCISVLEDSVLMDMAYPRHIETINSHTALRELYEIMGISLDDAPVELLPEIISTGLPDIIMPVSSRYALAAITPDFKALADLSDRYSVTGVHAFAPGYGSVASFCRNFAPLYDIDEEAATGTSSGALAYYIHRNGMACESEEMTFVQGEAMNRPSKITVRTGISDAGDWSVRVGGKSAVLASGEINI